MRDVVELVLPTQVSIIIGLWCFYIVLWGRQDWAVGMYLASAYAARSIMIGPIVHTWLFLGTLLGAVVVRAFRRERYYALPRTDRWIVVWMTFWWCWILILLWQFDPEVKMSILRYLTLYIVAPLPAVLQISRDLKQVRSFAVAFISVALAGAVVALYTAVGSLSVPGVLSGITVGFFGIANYHVFSQGLGIGLILTVVLFMTSAGVLARVAWITGAMLSVVLLFLAGSRQSMLGVTVVLLLFVVRTGFVRGSGVVSVMAVASAVALVGAGLYSLLPEQILRVQSELGASALYSSFEERIGLWTMGMKDFLASPVWGWGFNRFWAHNLFIGGFADQGLTGIVFLCGFLWFLLRRAREWLVASPGDAEVWQFAFLGVAVFGLVHSQMSGNPVSVWHLYWSAAFLWGLGSRRSPGGRAAPEPRLVAATS